MHLIRHAPIRLIVALQILLLSQPALACYSMPKTLARDHAALVAEASMIALVTALPSTAPEQCTIKVVEVLKGQMPPALPVPCKLPGSGDWMTSFTDHTQEAFWKRRSGRLGINGDCSLVPPAFAIGRNYLVLLTAPDQKQFEQIDSANDAWLAFIRTQLNAKTAK